ncbi:hypothetical protein F5Y17DRAFT_13510 [Xylariaceae sp. FL0594]|nr:hypothetical protein F5Y17DRAFT_13510 [Xylariaceae sp. FL0594]
MIRMTSARIILRGPRSGTAPIKSFSAFGWLQHSTSRRLPIGLVSAGASSPVPSAVSGRWSLANSARPFATKSPGGFQQGIDREEEKRIAQRKLASDPAAVTTESSVRHVYEPAKGDDTERPVREGVKDDLKIVQETFSLANVPKEPYWLGLAGTLPYLGTSASTVYLAWVINTGWPVSSAFLNHLMISQETASKLLAILEPIQLGYGAVIISFLGAVHWGMEYAEKTPNHARTRFRYGLGVVAPFLAWPTLFLPTEFALTAQFGALVALYMADARATVRGWAPAWYSTYRFALTAVVGMALAISLIGRAKVGDASPRLTGLGEKFHQTHGEETYSKQWEQLEQRDRQKMKKKREEGEETERQKKEEEEQAEAEEGKKGKEKEKEKKQSKGSDEGEKGGEGNDKK